MLIQNHDESSAALREAMVAFPTIVPIVADKADIVLPGDLRAHPSFRIRVEAENYQVVHSDDSEPVLDMLSHLYAHRSHSLWKLQGHVAWFKEVAARAFQEIKDSPSSKIHPLRKRFNDMFARDRLNKATLFTSVCRHVTLLPDTNAARRLMAFIPMALLPTEMMACDPMPPPTSLSKYNADFFVDTDDFFAPTQTREEETMQVPVHILRVSHLMIQPNCCPRFLFDILRTVP